MCVLFFLDRFWVYSMVYSVLLGVGLVWVIFSG